MTKQLYIALTGEGKSDIGYTEYSSGNFVPGPMTCVARRLINIELGGKDVSFVYDFLDEQELTKKEKASPSSKRQSSLSSRLACRPVRKHKFTGLVIRSRVYGEYVKSSHPEADTLCGILFTDADGTRSTERGRWEDKFRAIQQGFADAGFAKGVPMVPQPKSEAWLLGYYQKDIGKGHPPFQNCKQFEEIGKSDHSAPQNRAKTLLDQAWKKHTPDSDELLAVSWENLDMPSFTAFKNALNGAVENMKPTLPDKPESSIAAIPKNASGKTLYSELEK